MQFPNIDDEDGDFGGATATRSRLSSLFQTERAIGDVNQALTFTAPKQPKKNEKNGNPQTSQATLKLIHSATVHAYKLIDDNYTNQGKLGCAILGSHETSDYKLLLYKGKQETVSICNIVPTFNFHIQPNNYATFYNDKNENWSLNFDVETVLSNFAKQIAVTKANAQDKSSPTLVIQDLSVGDGTALEMGDAAEVKYTGWILSNFSFGREFDSNAQSESAFRLRLGRKVIKGWSEGLVGAQKGTRRVLVVPPSLAYGSEGMGSAVPPHSTLIFEIAVLKVKKSRDTSHSPSPLKVTASVPEKKPEVLPRHSFSSEDNIRTRGASISEQLSQSPKKDKAQLISRMAKMGTATLPFHGAIPAQADSGSESEEEIQKESPAQVEVSPSPSPKPQSRKNSEQLQSIPNSRKNSEQLITAQLQESSPYHVSHPPSSVSFYPQAVLPTQQYATPTNAYPTFQHQVSTSFPMQYSPHTVPGMIPHMPSIVDAQLPLLISESRSQNTEVRLSLSKISEKVDSILQKIDNTSQGRISHQPFMDSAMLVQTIERIVQENSQLKEDIECKNLKIESLSEKVCDLLQRNQRFFEESNSMLEKKSDASAESQTKLLQLEKEKFQLSSELSESVEKLKQMERELQNYSALENEFNSKLREEQSRVEELESKISNLNKNPVESDNSASVNALQNEIQTLHGDNQALNTRLKEWEERCSSLDNELRAKTQELQDLQNKLEGHTLNTNVSSSSEYEEKMEALTKEIKSLKTEEEGANLKCKDLELKLSDSTKSESFLRKKLSTLQAELQSALVWKEKYEVFHQKTRQMKENYESERQRLIAEVKQSQSFTGSADFSGEIKKVMNVLYKLLQGKFELQSMYSGKEVLGTTLQAIRGLTLQMLQKKDQRSDSLEQRTDSDASSEKTVSDSESTSAEVLPLENNTSTVDNTTETSEKDIKQDNDISDKEAASTCDSTITDHELKQDVPVLCDFEQKDNDDSIDESNSALQNNIDSKEISPESKEVTKPTESLKDTLDKTVLSNQSRDSPEHSEQLSSTNVSEPSLFAMGTPKVSDETFAVHD